jgi:hypothetical protein
LRVNRLSDSYQIIVQMAERKRRWQGVGFDPDDKLRFADRPQDAPIVHLNGPMSIGLLGKTPTLEAGKKGESLSVGIGTPGLGSGTFAAFPGCASPDVPLTLHLEFAKDGAPGETIKERTTLESQH